MKSNFKKNFFCFVFFCGTLSAQCEPIIVPCPQTFEPSSEYFPAKKEWIVETPENLNLFIQPIQKDNSLKLTKNGLKKADLTFAYAKQTQGDEAYTLVVAPKEITIFAQAAAGWLYGFQTLMQMSQNAADIPCCTITDAPRFAWRGLMIDEARHFVGKTEVKRILDMMAMYKMNRFHWHLTDSEGWRIEIKKYPKLATVGGIGNWTSFQQNPKNPQGVCQFYTQEDIKEIVSYAKARCIEIIPEIDMPGHASAMNRAYPEYDGGGNERLPRFTLNPGKETTYSYLTDILKEITELFPSPWIHFGGDEVHFANNEWINLTDVKNLMQREKLNNLREVEHYFNRRMADSISNLGKVCMGWDEVVTAQLPAKNTLVNWWRHNKPEILQKALAKGYSVVLCPRHPCYFDFVQDDTHQHGRRWDGVNSWERVYEFPNFSALNITGTHESQILGIQACLWGETVPSTPRLEYLLYPRLQAFAESAWTLPHRKNIERFRSQSLPKIVDSCKKGCFFYNPFQPHRTPEIAPNSIRKVNYIDPATKK